MDPLHYDEYPRPHSPFSPWLLVALTAIVLVLAMVSSSYSPDSHEFVARQQTIHGSRAL
jgi:hypothetical protein